MGTKGKKVLYQLRWGETAPVPDLYLANRHYQPSYVSMETVLSDIGVIPEVSIGVVSVTTKATRRMRNQAGQFIYRHIMPRAFQGV